MSGKIIVFIIALVCIVMFVMQIVAIFHDSAYIKWDDDRRRAGTWYCGCGVFDCECGGWTLRKDPCGDRADHIKAACAFGILTIIWIGVSMVVHIMLCFAKTSGMILGNNMGVKFVNYMWVWHLISALFNLICWACLAGAFDRELCGWQMKNMYDLTWGFFVLVIITVVDAILAFVCWKHMHVYYSYSGGGGGGHRSSRGPPPGYYESNPIDRQGFHGRRY